MISSGRLSHASSVLSRRQRLIFLAIYELENYRPNGIQESFQLLLMSFSLDRVVLEIVLARVVLHFTIHLPPNTLNSTSDS